MTSAQTPAHRTGVVFLVACGATFLAMLDVTVVNVAFPDLRADFPNSPLTDLSWVVSSYAVLLAAFLTAAGRLADVLGRRRLFALSLLVFTISSAASAAAPNVALLITARAVQGAAAAGMIPAALGLVLTAVPASKRTMAVGAWAASGSMAAAAGPSLGGLLVDISSWRSVFWINVPTGILLLAATYRRLPADRPTGRRLPDLVGTLLVAAGVGLLVVGLTKANDWDWTDERTIGSLAGGVILLLAGVAKSRRHPSPAVETDLWGSRTFAMANLTSLLFGVALFAWLLLGPLYLTAVWNYSVLEAGLAVSPGALASAVAAVIAGRRATPRGQRIAVAGGALVFTATAFWMYATLGVEREFLQIWLWGNLLSGAAIGAALTGLASAAAVSVPPERFASGIGMNMTARQLGGALGIAALAAILTVHALPTVDDFLNIFLFCGIAAAVSAVAGLALIERSRPVATSSPGESGPVAAPSTGEQAGVGTAGSG